MTKLHPSINSVESGLEYLEYATKEQLDLLQLNVEYSYFDQILTDDEKFLYNYPYIDPVDMIDMPHNIKQRIFTSISPIYSQIKGV